MKKINKKKLVKFFPFSLYQKVRRIYKRLLYYYYSDSTYSCPCCGGTYKKFLAYGRHNRSNRRCPYDDSLARHRLLWIYFAKETTIFKEKLKILHIGPEDCFQNFFKNKKNSEYISGDLYSPKAMIKLDITDIPYESEKFDVIICLHVLEHIEDDLKALAELYRVLRQNGNVYIQSPIDFTLEKTFEDKSIRSPKERERNFGQPDHVRLYGLDLKERLESAGFSVIVEKYAQKLPKNIINKYVLDKDQLTFVCTKL